MDDNIIILLIVAILYALVNSESFRWKNASDDETIGSQVLSKGAVYAAKVLLHVSTMLVCINKGENIKPSKDLSYFWFIVFCLLAGTLLIICIKSNSELYNKEKKITKIETNNQDSSIPNDWLSIKIIFVICVCFQFPEQFCDLIPEQLIKRKLSANYYDNYVFHYM